MGDVVSVPDDRRVGHVIRERYLCHDALLRIGRLGTAGEVPVEGLGERVECHLCAGLGILCAGLGLGIVLFERDFGEWSRVFLRRN